MILQKNWHTADISQDLLNSIPRISQARLKVCMRYHTHLTPVDEIKLKRKPDILQVSQENIQLRVLFLFSF